MIFREDYARHQSDMANLGKVVCGGQEFDDFLMKHCNTFWGFPPVAWSEDEGMYVVWQYAKG